MLDFEVDEKVMRIAFVPQAGALGLGGITRCLALAETACLRGHEVAFFAPPDYPLLGESDLGIVLPVPRPSPVNLAVGEAASFGESLAIRGLTSGEYLESAIEAELNNLKDFRPAVVITENQPSIPISCHALGIPFAATIATINLRSFSPQIDSTYLDDLRAVGAWFGVDQIRDPEDLFHERAILNIAPTIEVLEPGLSTVPRTLFCGPLLYSSIELAPCQWRHSDLPTVLVYLSRGLVTIDNLMPAITEAFPPSTHRVIIAASSSASRIDGPPNVFIERTPGITRALQHCDLVITRGGQNTLMACMLAARPVLGTPGWSAEPTFNLQVLSAHGAARSISGLPDGQSLLSAASDLANSLAAERARQIGRLLRRRHGAAEVLSKLEEIIGD